MKKILGKIIGTVLLGACIALVIILLVISGGRGGMDTCCGMEVEYFPKSYGLNDAETIRSLVEDKYGVFVGQRADSVGLDRIEKLLDSVGSIKKSQVYITSDGMLHVMIEERKPRISFSSDGQIRYADIEGKVFRSEGMYNGEVPVAHGRPLQDDKGWMKGILEVASYVESSHNRGIDFSGIVIREDGSILIKSADGPESFIFGIPSPGESVRLRRIDRYYRDIRGKEDYSTVDVRYKGQIICKK